MDILVGEMAQNNVGREVGDAQMLRRKDARLRRNIALVVGNGTMTDNQASDVQVERSMAGGIFRSQRIEHELDVHRALGILFVDVGVETEELGRRNRNLAILQRQEIEFCRYARSTDHAVALLVEHHHVIYDNAVEEAQVHLSDTYLSAEFLGQRTGYFRADEGLYWWHVQQYDKQEIDSSQRPYNAIDDMF